MSCIINTHRFPHFFAAPVTVLFGLTAAYAQPRATLTLSSLTLEVGESGVVEARLDCGDVQCSLFAITLSFDPAVIQVDSVELGAYLGDTAQGEVFIAENQVDNAAGVLRLAAVSVGTPPSPTENVLFRLNVTAVAAGTTELAAIRLEVGDLNAVPIHTDFLAPLVVAQNIAIAHDRFATITSSASPLVAIEGGTFNMGTTPAEVSAAVQECVQGYGGEAGACDISFADDSLPAHPVTVSPFFIETTEVSYEQFLNFLNAMEPGSHRNGCFNQPCAQTLNESETSNLEFDSQSYYVNDGILNFPVANVTWYGAQAYCQAIGRRLPTEAEWERAARGTHEFIFPWGNDWNGANAATRRNENGEPVQAQPIVSYPLGAAWWGSNSVLNMSGNVSEWVSDWYDATYYGTASATGPDPQGPATGTEKVNRGGSWDTVPFFARAVHRREQNPIDPRSDVGFRCARDFHMEEMAFIESEDNLNLLTSSSCPTHTLREGDTPFAVAVEYGVDYEVLMAVNNLNEESVSFLRIGDELIVPLNGCDYSLDTATLTATLVPTAENAPNAQVEIVRVLGVGSIMTEGVEIRNNGPVVGLEGWTLVDSSGNTYTFPSERRLFSGGLITVYTRVDNDSAIALFWDQTAPIWTSGDTAILIDSAGHIQSVLQIR